MLAVQVQTEQGATTHEGPALLQTRVQFFGRDLSDNADEYPIHTYRAAQRSVVRHHIGPCAGWETKTKIEQAIPNVGAGAVIGETHQFVIIGVAQGNIGRQGISELEILAGVDRPIEWMRVSDQTMLRVGQGSDHAIVRIWTRKG